MVSIKKPPVYRVIVVQVGVIALLYFIVSLFSKIAAFSVLLGGLVCIVPHAYFTFCVYQFTGARSTRLVARGFNRGESGKFDAPPDSSFFKELLTRNLLYVEEHKHSLRNSI